MIRTHKKVGFGRLGLVWGCRKIRSARISEPHAGPTRPSDISELFLAAIGLAGPGNECEIPGLSGINRLSQDLPI